LLFGKQSITSLTVDPEVYGYTRPIVRGILSPTVLNGGSYAHYSKRYKETNPKQKKMKELKM
jgi:hypothetical protein